MVPTPYPSCYRALEKSRDKFNHDSYLCQGPDDKPFVNPAAVEKLDSLEGRYRSAGLVRLVLDAVHQMLHLGRDRFSGLRDLNYRILLPLHRYHLCCIRLALW